MDKLYLLVPVFSQEINRFSRKADCFPFGKGDVETGGVVVDELKEEHLEGQAVFVVRFGPWKLCRKDFRLNHMQVNTGQKYKSELTKVSDPDGDPLIENVEDHDHNKADEGGGDGRCHLRRHVLL